MLEKISDTKISDANPEIDQLLDTIWRLYRYDFRNYARPSLDRRIRKTMYKLRVSSFWEMNQRIADDQYFFGYFLSNMSITYTDMFRDASFYKALREKVPTILDQAGYLKIWLAGCATGEEVYSIAILLKELGCYQRCQIYATDYNKHALKTAREGIYSADRIQRFSQNYYQSGGVLPFNQYYHANYGLAKFKQSLKEKIIFAHHNLANEENFNEMHLIICRNVIIYFNQTLKNQVLSNFCHGLNQQGVLCLGNSETIEFSGVSHQFDIISKRHRIYRKIAAPQTQPTMDG